MTITKEPTTRERLDTILVACEEFLFRSQPSKVGRSMVVSGDAWDAFHCEVVRAIGIESRLEQMRRMGADG